jgi:hypothetical protein
MLTSGGTSPRTEHYVDTFYERLRRGSLWTASFQCQKDFGSAESEPDDTFVDGCYDRKADPDFTKPVPKPELMAKLEARFAAQLAAAEAAPVEQAGTSGGQPAAKGKAPNGQNGAGKAKAKAKAKAEAPE